ncbi:hypothetical protein JOS77_16710 [Chromobacterium haemolyticum]|nr:hypothetical protein JOS77_16710 [Chromobacterium haemolyticum]
MTYKAQSGISLLESLIAMLLLMLTGLGIVFVNARSQWQPNSNCNSTRWP